MRYKSDGYVIQVGDTIEADLHAFGKRYDVVTRVTTTQAICEKTRPDGSTYVNRYRRVVGFWFGPVPRATQPGIYRVIDKE